MTPVLPDFKDLAFDPVKHIYRLAGKYLPAVSTIIKPLSASVYKDIDADILQNAAARGTSIHESIENFIKYGITESSDATAPYMAAFEEWWQKYKPTPIRSEYRVYHPVFRYAGTTDFICEIDGKIICIDYKSSVAVSEMLTRLQLEAYAKAIKAHGAPIDGKAVLHLRRDGSYDYITHPGVDSGAWEVFGALLTVYNYQQKYQGGT